MASINMEDSDFIGQVLVFSIIGCPHCLRAKNTLTQHHIPYVDISVDKYENSVKDDLVQRTKRRTVPQIFFNDTYIGGNDELTKLVNDSGKFSELIEKVKKTPAPDSAPKIPDNSKLLDAGDGSADFQFVCEPDEYFELVTQIKKSGIIKSHRTGLLSHTADCFTARDLLDWLVRAKHIASELGEDLRKLILKIYSVHLTPDGKSVDYGGVGSSREFREDYVTLARQLHRVTLTDVPRREKLAFFINIYNALVIHANVERGPPHSLWARYKFFNTVRYIIAGHSYSLQDIENGVLRANRRGVGMWSRPFGKNDPRLAVSLDEPEPLIHFGLNCGARSCPPIKTYTSKGVMNELRIAAEAFLESDDGCYLDTSQSKIYLSQIFKWYREDFGTTSENLAQWVYDHLGPSDSKKKGMKKMLDSGKYQVNFIPYDWSTNTK